MMRSGTGLPKVRAILVAVFSRAGESERRIPRAHLGAEQAELRGAGVGELEVVHAHDAHAARIDDLFVQDVAGEQDFIRLQVGEANVGGHNPEADLIIVKGFDVLTPTDHERGLAGTGEGEARYAGEDFARSDAEIGNDAKLIARSIEYWIPQELGEVDHACSLRLHPSRRRRKHAARGYRL